MNVFSAIGRIGRDAQVRSTSAGRQVAGWSLAVDSGFGDNKKTMWIDCALWGDRAERLAQYIRKGDRIGITGELGTREHEGKTYVTCSVRDVTLLGDKRDNRPAEPRHKPVPNCPQPERDDFEDSDIPF